MTYISYIKHKLHNVIFVLGHDGRQIAFAKLHSLYSFKLAETQTFPLIILFIVSLGGILANLSFLVA